MRSALVLVASLALAYAACDGAGLGGCGRGLTTCIENNHGSQQAICSCRGQYDSCVQGLGCNSDIVNGVVQACQEAGCSAAQCAPSMVLDLASIFISPEACDAPTLEACGASLTSCVEQNAASPSGICSCRGTYDGCLQNAGCPAATVQAVVAACQEAGCTAAQCAPSLVLDLQAVMKARAPLTCDAPTLEACGASLTSCVEQNATNPAGICTCRGTYDGCLQNAGCPAATVQAVVAACEESGCTAAQCSP